MEDTVNKILKAMSSVKKPQRIFITALFAVLMIFQGRATFRNLSRYCEMSEKRLSRWYRRSFDFTEFNFRLLSEQLPAQRTLIAAIDASFMEKSGRKQKDWPCFITVKQGCVSVAWSFPLSVSSICKPILPIIWMHDKNSFIQEGETKDGEGIYTAVFYSKMLKQPVRVVMLCRGEKYALLFSTDTALDADTVVAWYKARFQIEFVFRDARQHTGLTHCQSLRKESIHTHINASFTTLNLMKLQDRKSKDTASPTVISIASWKRRKRNQHLMCILFDRLDLSLNDQKVNDVYTELSEYGTIAA